MHEQKEKATTHKRKKKKHPAFLMPTHFPKVYSCVCLPLVFHELFHPGHMTVGARSVTMQLYYEQIGICGLNCP